METLGIVLISFAGIFIIFIGFIVAWNILRGEIKIFPLVCRRFHLHHLLFTNR